MSEMRKDLIAPCGMNCSLCIAYQFKEKDLNSQGFHRTYCPGCITRGKNCTHMGDSCELLGKGAVRFCYECVSFPCKRLKSLDKRYHTKYHMSMIENLTFIILRGFSGKVIHDFCPDFFCFEEILMMLFYIFVVFFQFRKDVHELRSVEVGTDDRQRGS